MFIAVDLPPAAAGALQPLLDSLALPGARRTDPGQLHFTLRFMAAIPEEQAPRLAHQLAAVRCAPFALALRGVGVFPGGRKPPRVLWVGVAPEVPLRALKARIDDVLGPDEESAGRGFTPHLTLARFREPPGPALDGLLAARAAFATEPFAVETFHLYRSTLGRSGALHEILQSYPLRGA
jgi:2'-5' RNA ligase